MNHRNTKDRGFVLILVVAFMAILLSASASVISYTTQSARAERSSTASAQALALAEAGIDKAIYQLNEDSNYSGESGTALGSGTFTTAITSVDGSTKRITSTAYVPNSSRPIATRTVKVTATINTSVVSFRFGVQVGEGGVTMNNGAIITGNVFSNGDITGSGWITGDTTLAAETQTTPDQSWTTQNADFAVANTATRAFVAQSFTPTATSTLNKASILLKKIGAPGDMTIKLVADAGGKPATTTLAQAVLRSSWVTGNYFYVDLYFDTLAKVSANKTYWLVLSAPVNASDYFIWGADSGAAYARGTAVTSPDWDAYSTWSSAGNDMDFKIYLASGTTTISGITMNGNATAPSLANCSVGKNAYYASISNCSVSGQSVPNSAPVAPAGMPISDGQIDEWETEASSGGTITGPYTIANTQTLGPKKINGNLTVTGTLSLTGPVWVNGNISINNGGRITTDLSLGKNGAVLIADSPGNESSVGTVTVTSGAYISYNGNAGSYPLIISTNTGAASISTSNMSGGYGILYAPRGTVSVTNAGGAIEVTAYRLLLNNLAGIFYQSGIQNATFSDGPGGSWAFVPGSYVITK